MVILRRTVTLKYTFTIITVAVVTICLWELLKCRPFSRAVMGEQGRAQTCSGCSLHTLYTDVIARASDAGKQEVGEKQPDSKISQRNKPGRTSRPVERGDKSTRNFLPVYVFEEHHEAVPYWYGAVQSGLLPKRSGNTLIHIDGHADFMGPTINKTFPMFRWPQFKDIARLMTENDKFIVSSALTGLFSRVIWIWPRWDGEHLLKSLYGNSTTWNVTVGFYWRVTGYAQSTPEQDSETVRPTSYEKDLCFCVKSLTPPVNWNATMQGSQCMRWDSSDAENYLDKADFNCPVVTSVIVETHSEDSILEASKPNGDFFPIARDEGFILDIDEDFFGCGAAVQPLYNAGVDEGTVRAVSAAVKRLFCGGAAEHERVVDQMFSVITEYLADHRQFCELSEKKKRYTDSSENSCLNDIYSRLLSILRQNTEKIPLFNSVFCGEGNDNANKDALFELLFLLVSVNNDQLKAFADVGVCFQASQNIFGDEKIIGHFRTCDGYNRPNASIVTFFTPSEQEVIARGRQLDTILTQLSMRPDLVTVCRSVRDGYTPRSRFRQIEDLVLGLLQKLYSPVGDVNVFYDRDLLGGQHGWPERREGF